MISVLSKCLLKPKVSVQHATSYSLLFMKLEMFSLKK